MRQNFEIGNVSTLFLKAHRLSKSAVPILCGLAARLGAVGGGEGNWAAQIEMLVHARAHWPTARASQAVCVCQPAAHVFWFEIGYSLVVGWDWGPLI